MNEKKLVHLIDSVEEYRVSSTLDLWPKIRDRVKQRYYQKQRKRRAVFSLTLAALLTALALWVFSPGLRSTMAQTIDRLIISISGDSDGPSLYAPAPPFTVLQPNYLPKGFRLTENEYQSGQESLPSIRVEAITDPRETVSSVSTANGPNIVEGRAYILQKYTAPDGRYFSLFEREAADEALPAGEVLSVAGHTAKFEKDGEMLHLTWIDAGTWIELEGVLTINELLKVAEGLVTTQEPDKNTSLGEQARPNIIEQDAGNLQPCDPGYVPAPKDRPLLGKIEGQHELGSLVIYLWNRDLQSETIGLGANVPTEEIRQKIYEPALQALQDSNIQLERLIYPTIGVVYTLESGCWAPPPELQGYVVIEVWENRVNLGGYGETVNVLKERAIKALKEEMKSEN